MAIHELKDEEIRTWSLEKKDRWWLENVFRGDMPQLTLRSATTGMILGGVLSLTNLYIGAKTGWTLGVGITSVILAFAMFKVLASLGLADEFTVLENNAMQSIATAAGYMTSPMISSLAALMLIQNQLIPAWQTMCWIIALAILGVLFAFPFKRRFINDEQQPFPEGRAAGVVMDSLHHGDAASGLLKAKLLVIFSSLAAVVRLCQSEAIAQAGRWRIYLAEFLDEWIYDRWGTPTILGTPVTQLTLRPELDLPMLGVGGLMGIRIGVSILLGAIVNYAILAPIFIERGDILPNPRSHLVGFREITFWSLWCGVAMMTVASVMGFFAKPSMIFGAFRKLWSRKENSTDVLAHIELPLKVSLIGIPLVGALVICMAYAFFNVRPEYAALAIALVFFFCLIAINSTGLTSFTPIGAMGKLTQLTFGAIAKGDKSANLVTAGITGEVASNAANLVSDIKPGYMLGAKPRQQAVGHVLGVIAGALLSVPVFYLVFIRDANQPIPPERALAMEKQSVEKLGYGDFPMPAASIWKGVADVLAEGVEKIPVSARWTALAGLLVGILLEVLRIRTGSRFPISPIGVSLGFVIHFHTCLTMFLGAFIFWIIEKTYRAPESKVNQVVVQNQEPICAGLIAGGALMGIIVAAVEVFLLAK